MLCTEGEEGIDREKLYNNVTDSNSAAVVMRTERNGKQSEKASLHFVHRWYHRNDCQRKRVYPEQ